MCADPLISQDHLLYLGHAPGGGASGELYEFDTDTGATRLITTNPNSTTFNLLAAADTPCLAYYGDDTTTFYYDVVADTHNTLSDLAADYAGTFLGGRLDSGAATFVSASRSLFIGAEGAPAPRNPAHAEAIYELMLDAAGTAITGIQRFDLHAIAAADPETPVAEIGGFGDILSLTTGDGVLLLGASRDANTNTSYLWTFEPATSGFTLISSAPPGWWPAGSNGRRDCVVRRG